MSINDRKLELREDAKNAVANYIDGHSVFSYWSESHPHKECAYSIPGKWKIKSQKKNVLSLIELY